MTESIISYKGKVKVQETLEARQLTALLNYLVNEGGFSVGHIKEGKIKLTKTDEATDTGIKIEIECSEKEYEIEIKAADADTVKQLTDDLSKKLK